ncbi:hypothetical protein KR51_00030120 [Rubidibacter lacunae KORDI 51-2]|uniref:Uncharacterized protein n=1 Tax=Rubidibacter lacunae KORDI 51-2 TaxID=582515 RepID=U5D746_9CHRO|nr:DUF6439 family protein [Rubidibacter lacunae]ERN40468.1 hypothetical protein KR51_00030120 [Rubidibacter lacunae KORDI 51-2]
MTNLAQSDTARDTGIAADAGPLGAEAIARTLAEQLAIAPQDWHRLKSNRRARAAEQAAAALVYLLGDRPEEAIPRLQQAIGWLDRSISAPPCPTHGPASDAGERSQS